MTNNDVYDLASVTKITATTPSFMRFYEEGIFKLDDSLNKHLPDSIARVNKRRSTFHNVTFREMLIHKSGAPAGLKILPYIQYQDDSIGKWDSFFCNEENGCFSVPLSSNFFLDHDYVDSLWLLMNKTWLNPAKPYKYSDINMNMLYMLMKSKLRTQSFSRYVDSTFYKPLGLKTMGYHPLTNLDTNKHRITPTEYDTYWRGEVLKGYVHDPTAALFGGEAGSAGLFSNVHDLGIFYQMLLNGGTYGGKRYLQKSTVDLFTRHQPGTFRGLGFNKPTGQRSSTKSIDCPTTGYGHTGFTGICVWVDPVNDLIFVFCSNRVHPSPRNNKINTKGIRARMHQVLYNQILGRPETRDTTMLP
ncbi:MAG: CubicO group peptidase (beta-lactamase class C family) [Nonlabens sp.]